MNTLENAAKRLVGNHINFDSFGWDYPPDNEHLWCLVSLRNRDSELLEEANAIVYVNELAPFRLAEQPTVLVHRFSHYLCGWTENLAIRVYDEDGQITPAFTTWYKLWRLEQNYPVLDEELYSRLYYEETLANIAQHCDEAEAPLVYDWLSENNSDAFEHCDSRGAPYPTELAVNLALAELTRPIEDFEYTFLFEEGTCE